MILMREDRIGEIAAIHAAPASRFEASLPTVFFYHNFGASKELSAFFAYMLAAVGLRAVVPDAPIHGDRLVRDPSQRPSQFWNIVRSGIDELADYSDFYVSRKLADPQAIGVAGTSMGGFCSLGSLVRYPWLKAAVSYMGSGYFFDVARTVYPPFGSCDESNWQIHEQSLLPLQDCQVPGHIDKIASRPLFLWHGMRDDVVHFSESVRLQADLCKAGLAGRSEFTIDPNAGHRVTADGATRGVNFLARHLGSVPVS